MSGTTTLRGADASVAKPKEAKEGAAHSSSFRRDIQGLRAIAVIAVVLYHAETPFVGGFVGVDVFFVISGFVISGLLLRELEDTGSIDLRRFYSRRVRRLVPALGVMLAVVGLLSTLLLSPFFPQPVALRTAAWAAASGGNIYLWLFGGGYFSPGDEQNPFVHTWSLGIEEQFYLVFPLLVAVVWRTALRRNWSPRLQLRNVLLGVIVMSFAVSLLFTYDLLNVLDRFPGGERFAFYGTLGRAWEFGVGVLLALVMGRRKTLGPAGLARLGAGALVVTFLLLDESIRFPGVVAVVPVLATALLLLNGDTGMRRLLEVEALVWIGDRSYGWYLWHWPFVVFAKQFAPDIPFSLLIASLLALIPTIISYTYVETPLRAKSGEPTGKAVRTSLIFSVLPFLLLAVAAWMPTSAWGLPERPEREETSASNSAGCFEYWATTEDCTFDPPGVTAGTALLVGDSHAGAISSVVLDTAANLNLRTIVHTVSACPFAAEDARLGEECLDHNDGLIDLAAAVEPDVIIVANRSTVYTAQFDLDLDHNAPTPAVEGAPSDQAIEAWQHAVGSALRDVSPHVDRLVLFSVVPEFEVDAYDRSLPTLVFQNGLAHSRDRDEVQELRVPLLEAEADVLAELPVPALAIDPIDAFCEDVCRFQADDRRYWYRDPHHLTPFGANRLLEDFTQAMLG